MPDSPSGSQPETPLTQSRLILPGLLIWSGCGRGRVLNTGRLSFHPDGPRVFQEVERELTGPLPDSLTVAHSGWGATSRLPVSTRPPHPDTPTPTEGSRSCGPGPGTPRRPDPSGRKTDHSNRFCVCEPGDRLTTVKIRDSCLSLLCVLSRGISGPERVSKILGPPFRPCRGWGGCVQKSRKSSVTTFRPTPSPDGGVDVGVLRT